MVKISKKLFFCMAFLFIFIIPLIIPLTSGQECFSDIQCNNAGGPIPKSGTTYIKEFCNTNGICEATELFIVECTSSAFCAQGQICDTSSTNYGKCVGEKPETQSFIETKDNSVTSAWIIALGIIVGLIALGLILRKRK